MVVHCPAGRRFDRDCSTDNLMCLTNSSSQAVCGIGPCNDDGSGDDESGKSCLGTRRTRCSQRVEVTGTDCADRGLSCVQSAAAEPQRSGCGARYTGCSASECRGSEMVYCEDGAETPVDCRRIDNRLGSCVLAQTGGGDPVPSCAVAAAERTCMQGDDFCDGDVAHVCAGGLRYEMDCATFSARTSTLAGASSVTARCVEVGGGRGVRCDLGD